MQEDDDFTVVTARFCHPYMSFSSEDGCNEVELKFTQPELRKIQVAEISNEQGSEVSNSDLAVVWSVAFSSVLFFYFVGLGIGNVLQFLKRAL